MHTKTQSVQKANRTEFGQSGLLDVPDPVMATKHFAAYWYLINREIPGQ